MHVKLENIYDMYDVAALDIINHSDLKLVENNLRDELFGNTNFASDFSESSSSHSDEEKTLSIEQQLLGDFPSSLGSCSATSSRSSSASFDQFNFGDSLNFNLHSFCSDDDEDSPESVMVDPMNLELKHERCSPDRSSVISSHEVDQLGLWQFLSGEDIKPSIKTPESPPLTPPNESPSPPLSPISITSHEFSSGSIPTTAIITVTQVESHRSSNYYKKPMMVSRTPMKVTTASKKVEKKPISRNIQIQPRFNAILTPKPMIKMENGTPKVALLPSAHKVQMDTKVTFPKPMIISPQHSNYIPSAFNILETASQTCTVVSERKPPLPTIAPLPNPTMKNNGITEVRAVKRQERMIKNRESASLSRKRKKEYVQSLEEKLKELDYENCRLSEENLRLRKRLSSLDERSTFKGTRFPLKRTSSTALLGVTFFFLLNINSMLNLFRPSDSTSLLNDSAGISGHSSLVSDVETNVNNRFSQRSLLWFSSSEDINGNLSTICPLYVNATESIRIENELRDWFANRLESTNDKLSSKRRSTTIAKKIKSSRERMTRRKMAEEKALTASPNKKVSSRGLTDVYRYLYHPEKFAAKETRGLTEGMESFLGTFERRNDTYYVVTLSSDHILLPASAHNTSARPKMSLLVPTSRPVHEHMDGPLSVMQIDCEVTGTKLVSYEGINRHAEEPLRTKFSAEEARNSSVAEGKKVNKKSNRTRFSVLNNNNV